MQQKYHNNGINILIDSPICVKLVLKTRYICKELYLKTILQCFFNRFSSSHRLTVWTGKLAGALAATAGKDVMQVFCKYILKARFMQLWYFLNDRKKGRIFFGAQNLK